MEELEEDAVLSSPWRRSCRGLFFACFWSEVSVEGAGENEGKGEMELGCCLIVQA